MKTSFNVTGITLLLAASNLSLVPLAAQGRVLVATNSVWRYFKGTSEASSPTNAWRALDFDDSAWLRGPAPFHFGTNSVGGDDSQTGGTILSDMLGNYTCMFLRQSFVIEDTNQLGGLVLNAWYDDGFAVWINGQAPRGPVGVSGSSLAYTNTASSTIREANAKTRIDISAAFGMLRNGTNVLCLQAFNGHLTNDDFRIEVELTEAPPTLAFPVNSISVSEAAGQVLLPVVRAGSLEPVVTVDYATTNGTALVGQDYVATNGTLVFAAGQTEATIAVGILNDGLPQGTHTFQVGLSNPGGGATLATSNTTATVTIYDRDPVITTQPTNQFLNAPGSVTFSVTASETGLTYQWLFDGSPIAGATHSYLTVTNPQPAQWGYYSVIVSNAYGSVTSQVAELKVFVPALHRLSGIQAQPDGSMSLSFAGETTAAFAPYYDLYPLEASSNLVDWVPLVTLQRANAALDTLRFVDTNAPNFSQRFYRTPTNQLATPDPASTGPYAVGTFSMVMTDPSRTNAAGGTNYQFMTTFWYPTVSQAGLLPAKYVEPQVAGIYNMTPYGGGNFSNQVAAFFSHSLSNAPLAANEARCPVVLYSPGGTWHRRDNTDKAEDLASWGYVVVGVDGRDTSVSVFPNGTVLYGQPLNVGSIASLDAALESRLRDLQFVLDQLEVLNARDPRLAARLDLAKIGAFGYSLGGCATPELCVRDTRVKAGVALDGDPYWETNSLVQPLGVPFLFVRNGDGPDPNPGLPMADGRPDNRFEPYHVQVTNAFWVKLVSTDHGSLGNGDLILDSASLVARAGTPMSGQFLPPARVSEILRAYLLSFFNKFLQGQDDHLLDGPSPAYLEVMQFLSTASASGFPKYPSAGLVQGNDGTFYGTTAFGGGNGVGTVFQVTTNGELTTVASFNGTNGSHPAGALLQGSDGSLYGTTAYGGTNGNNGTVYQVTSAGVLTTLVSFNGLLTGSHCVSGLAQGSDGNFYGTTAGGGAWGCGTAFRMTPNGALTTLAYFNGANGNSPQAALVEGSDGNFYGTTTYGGPNRGGTVFKMTPAGVLTTLVAFQLQSNLP